MSKLLSLKSVSHSFIDGESSHQVLCDINMSIEANESVALVGSSSSGKTTLLHIASMLSIPKSGQIMLTGKDMSKASEHELQTIRQNTLGFVFQTQHFMPMMTVLENVSLPLRIRGDKDCDEKAEHVLKSLNISEKHFSMYPHILSGGEQARIGLARAIVHKPQLLIADEPTASLDHDLTSEIFSYLKSLRKSYQFATLIATHDRSVLTYVDTVYQLQQGSLLEIKDV